MYAVSGFINILPVPLMVSVRAGWALEADGRPAALQELSRVARIKKITMYTDLVFIFAPIINGLYYEDVELLKKFPKLVFSINVL